MGCVDADEAGVASLPQLGEGRVEAACGHTDAERLVGQASGVHRAGGELLRGVEQQLLCALVIPVGVGGPRSRSDDVGQLMREWAVVAHACVASF